MGEQGRTREEKNIWNSTRMAKPYFMFKQTKRDTAILQSMIITNTRFDSKDREVLRYVYEIGQTKRISDLLESWFLLLCWPHFNDPPCPKCEALSTLMTSMLEVSGIAWDSHASYYIKGVTKESAWYPRIGWLSGNTLADFALEIV